ncbi:iron complex transport system substrate-binding protein [Paenimyroides ummariense]|uniref:Iron complex transport system substrate-binding protein n=1 Tax=Paenimyroides ummariense TaxID=913024 RepID=A0A1I4ZY89_9FLAO|nr:ABC transporter substrate-binding protein [Paenimyroides ummariense]SFN55174.1 iron complex transport system substrate-binding protein [Paenimyroides ummariense]
MKKFFSVLALAIVVASCNKKEENKTTTTETDTVATEIKTDRIVSLNGAVTETLAALDVAGNIVGRDVTSTFPADLKATDLGHVRSITAESILALQPSVVFGTTKDVNPNLNEQLKKANIPLVLIDQEYSIDGSKKLITEVATKLKKDNYQPLLDNISNKMANVKAFDKKPKVLFIYARGAGNLMVAGAGTPLHSMIELAGAENAAAALTDFKPLTPEALLTTNPDVILMFDKGLQSLGGVDGLLKIEGIATTNAGKNKKVVTMDGQYLSGFGPRVGDAVVELHNKLQ